MMEPGRRFDKDALIASICQEMLNRPFDANVAKEVRRLAVPLAAHAKKSATSARAIASDARRLHATLKKSGVADDELIAQLDRLERCTGPDVRTIFEKTLAGKIARRLIENFSQQPLTLALLCKITPLVYQYITDKHTDGDGLERACRAALKDQSSTSMLVDGKRVHLGMALAPPISIPPKR
jgi:hypothetical protein